MNWKYVYRGVRKSRFDCSWLQKKKSHTSMDLIVSSFEFYWHFIKMWTGSIIFTVSLRSTNTPWLSLFQKISVFITFVQWTPDPGDHLEVKARMLVTIVNHNFNWLQKLSVYWLFWIKDYRMYMNRYGKTFLVLFTQPKNGLHRWKIKRGFKIDTN